MRGTGVDEVDEAGTAVELGEEDGGVCLGFGAPYPLKARADGAAIAAPFPEDPTPIATHLHLASMPIRSGTTQ